MQTNKIRSFFFKKANITIANRIHPWEFGIICVPKNLHKRLSDFSHLKKESSDLILDNYKYYLTVKFIESVVINKECQEISDLLMH
jgi:hypothetical protein